MAARAFVPLQTDEAGNPVAEQPIVPIADKAHPLYGRVTISAADCQKFADDFARLPVADGGERELPIYQQHDPSKGALGWLRGVRVDPQRGLIGRMVFNAAGTAAVKDETFPYLSPELTPGPNRKLSGLSLVVKGFFNDKLPKVQLFADPADLPEGTEAENLGILVFGDPADLGMAPDQVDAHARVNADPSLAPVPGSGVSAQATPGSETAGQQFSAAERVMNLERELAELQRERRVQTFAAELEGMTFGDPDQPLRLAPSLRDDLAAALAEAAPEVGQRIAGLLRTMPQRFYHPGEIGLSDSRSTTRALTADEKIVCEQLRMTPEEFLAGSNR